MVMQKETQSTGDIMKFLADIRWSIDALAVPLDENASLRVEEVMRPSGIEEAAKRECATTLNQYFNDVFGGDDVKVPAAGSDVAALRWAPWHETPTCAMQCVFSLHRLLSS